MDLREHSLRQLLARLVVALMAYLALSYAVVQALPPEDPKRTAVNVALFLAFAGYLAILTRPRLRRPEDPRRHS